MKLPRVIGVSGSSAHMRIELENIPDSFLEFVNVKHLSPNSIALGEWPEQIYAGRKVVGMDEKLRFFIK